jgi:polysaccharide export outer membrane protein
MTNLLSFVVPATLCLTLLGCASPGVGTSSGLTASPASPTESSSSRSGSQDQAKSGIPAVVGLPPDPGSTSTYRIGPNDLLDIKVFQVPELSAEERVNEGGFIVMPLIGAVKVGGLTPMEAETKIAQLLGKSYLQNPQVNIFVKEYANQNITVTGAVNKPGVFPLTGRTTLMQAVALAQGLNRLANDEKVIIFRSQNGKKTKAYIVDLSKVEDGTLHDPVLVADDRVVVPESGTAVVIDTITGSLRGLVGFSKPL